LSINRRTEFVRWLGKEFYREVGTCNGLRHQSAKAIVTLASMAVLAVCKELGRPYASQLLKTGDVIVACLS
jgi:hypothetical protein